MIFDSLSNCQLCQMILCLFFFLLLFVPDSELALSICAASPNLTWSWNRGRPHGFHLLLPEETMAFSSFILNLWGKTSLYFLLLFHRERFGNMNWRSSENNFSKMEKKIKRLMYPRTKNYAANGVIIETLQFMGCASGAAMCWCNFSWPIVHWDCIDCIIIHQLDSRQMILFLLCSNGFIHFYAVDSSYKVQEGFCFPKRNHRALRLPVDLQLMRFDDRRS